MTKLSPKLVGNFSESLKKLLFIILNFVRSLIITVLTKKVLKLFIKILLNFVFSFIQTSSSKAAFTSVFWKDLFAWSWKFSKYFEKSWFQIFQYNSPNMEKTCIALKNAQRAYLGSKLTHSSSMSIKLSFLDSGPQYKDVGKSKYIFHIFPWAIYFWASVPKWFFVAISSNIFLKLSMSKLISYQHGIEIVICDLHLSCLSYSRAKVTQNVYLVRNQRFIGSAFFGYTVTILKNKMSKTLWQFFSFFYRYLG